MRAALAIGALILLLVLHMCIYQGRIERCMAAFPEYTRAQCEAITPTR